MPTYGQTIIWTDFSGERHEISVDGCPSYERAKQEAMRFAKRRGWPGPPHWWQWWRRGDTKISEDTDGKHD